MPKQPPSSSIVKRLRRAAGNLKSIILTLEAGRSHLEVAQQLLAVGNVITNAKRALFHEHISRCLGARCARTSTLLAPAFESFKQSQNTYEASHAGETNTYSDSDSARLQALPHGRCHGCHICR